MALYVDPTVPRFSRSELVAEMADRFGDFTDGAFRRWQELGLVAAPRHSGRWSKGRTGSSKGLWSDHDRRMLISLLEKRDEHRTEGQGQLHVSELANLVVWSWVFWDGFVALDQARRALRTWAEPQLGGVHGRARSRERVRQHAAAAVAAVAAPEASLRAQRALASRISGHLWADDLDGLRALVPDMLAVIDPNGCGRRVGAPGASVDAEGEIERLTLCHLGARAVVSGVPTLSTKDWYAARRVMRASWDDYEREWLPLRATASTPEAFAPPDIKLQISLCSRTLLHALGRGVAQPVGLR